MITCANPPITLSMTSQEYSFASSLSFKWSPTILTPFPPVKPTGLTTTSLSNSSKNAETSAELSNTL